MAERKQTAQAANLQTKKRKGKIDKAHTLSGLGRAEFESAWNSLPEGVRKKCTAAELAQLVQIVSGMQTPEAQKPVNKSVNAWKALWERRRATIFRAPVRLSLPNLRPALTALVVRLTWWKR